MLHNPAGLRRRIGIVSVFAAVATTAACGGDSYERYGNAVHADVDAAMTEAFQITARLQLTVVHNRIPDDSLPVAARIVTRAARLVRKRAVHFAGVNPPPDFSEAHAGLSAALSRVADALEAMGSAFQRCAEAPCQAQLDSLSGRRYMCITYTDTAFESFGGTDRAITGVLVQRSSDSVRFRIHTTPDALVSMVDITVHPASERGERPVTRRIGMPKGDAAGRRDIGRLSRAARAARARRRRR